MSEALYELTGVERHFRIGPHTVRAVNGVDLAIEAGEFVAVQGASGSGKSTLLQLLGGLERPTAGTLRLGGEDIGRLGDSELTRLRLRDVGFVFQQFNLVPTLTAQENVEAALAPRRLPAAERRSRAEKALASVGLVDRARHLPSRLSGGEQQRVAIARAVVNEPRVVLADEPTGNLDTATADEVVDLLARLRAEDGRTVVMVTHDERLAARAVRTLRMRDGRLLDAA